MPIYINYYFKYSTKIKFNKISNFANKKPIIISIYINQIFLIWIIMLVTILDKFILLSIFHNSNLWNNLIHLFKKHIILTF